MRPPSIRVLAIEVVVLAGVDHEGDLARVAWAARLECGPTEIRYIRAHQTVHNAAGAPLSLTERAGETLCAAGLVIQQLAALRFADTLCELRRIEHVHAIRPAVVGLLHERILIVAIGFVRGFIA